MTDDITERLKNNDRYKTFTFFDKPVDFSEFFRDKDYPVVQIHDMTPIAGSTDIIGFAGVFKWIGNILTPLDGDSYTEHTMIRGYGEFEKNGEKCLDILAEEW